MNKLLICALTLAALSSGAKAADCPSTDANMGEFFHNLIKMETSILGPKGHAPKGDTFTINVAGKNWTATLMQKLDKEKFGFLKKEENQMGFLESPVSGTCEVRTKSYMFPNNKVLFELTEQK